MQKYVGFNLYQRNERGGFQPVGANRDAHDVYLASDVDALLKKLSDARLNWAMGCPCKCQACAELDDLVRDLMES